MRYSIFLTALLPLVRAGDNGTITLPQAKGPYEVTMSTAELVDESRLDPWNSSHVRRLMISRFDPIPREECTSKEKIPYMNSVVAQTESDEFSPAGLPVGLWARFEYDMCTAKPQTGGFPLALFSPGGLTSRLFHGLLAREVASHGFSVVTIDHPYDVDVVLFPNGDIIRGDGVIDWPSSEGGSVADVVKALNVRAADASFVLDQVGGGCKEVVMFGHSFGGAASATTMRADKRVVGGVNLDGTMWGPVVTEGLGDDRPFIMWGSGNHNTSSEKMWTDFYATLVKNGGWRREMSIPQTAHNSYEDINILVDIAGIRDTLSERALHSTGTFSGYRTWEIMGKYLPAFFNFALGRAPEDPIYATNSTEYPEVVILRE